MEVEVRPSPTFRPLPGGQREFLDDHEHRFVALEGGWGSGKTHAGAVKLLDNHFHNAYAWIWNPMRAEWEWTATLCNSVVIAPTFKIMFDTLVPKLQELMDEFGWAFQIKEHEIHLSDFGRKAGQKYEPSKILLRTAERPETIAGFQVGCYWCDEAARYRESRTNPLLDPLIQVRGRLRHPHARLLQGLYTYTNEGDHTRVYEDFHSERSDHAIYRASTRDNKHVAAFVGDLIKSLPTYLHAQYIEGEAVSLRGQRTYAMFHADQHVNKDLRYDPALPLQVTFDFNIMPGMHALIGQHSPMSDQLSVLHEVHEPRLNVRECVDRVRDVLAAYKHALTTEIELFGDATGNSEWQGTSESCYDVLRSRLDYHGIYHRMRVPRSNPPVTDRVNAFNAALLDNAGNTHWQVHPRCERLIEDLRVLTWGLQGDIETLNIERKHASDAEGYRVCYLRPIRPLRFSGKERFNVGNQADASMARFNV